MSKEIWKLKKSLVDHLYKKGYVGRDGRIFEPELRKICTAQTHAWFDFRHKIRNMVLLA